MEIKHAGRQLVLARTYFWLRYWKNAHAWQGTACNLFNYSILFLRDYRDSARSGQTNRPKKQLERCAEWQYGHTTVVLCATTVVPRTVWYVEREISTISLTHCMKQSEYTLEDSSQWHQCQVYVRMQRLV